MNYLHTICCVCLTHKEGLKQMLGPDNEWNYFTKLASCVPEMHFKEMDNMKVMCKECCDTVDMIYKYRAKCLRSKRILISCISQLGSLDSRSCDISVLLTDIAEKCNETEYKTTSKITDGNVPLSDQDTLPIKYERNMLLACDNEYQCDSDLSNIIKTENIDLPFSDTELDHTASDDVPSHDPLGDDELAANEINVKIDIEEQPLPKLEGDIDVFKSVLKCEKPDNEINNEDVSVQGTSVGTESSNKESNAFEAIFLKELSVNKKFTRKSKLNVHIQKHCDKTGDEQYDDKIYGDKISTKKIRYGDMKIHSDKSHESHVSNNKFTGKRNLSSHMVSHTGGKTHECNLCNKKFTRNTSLSIHMLIHTGEKPHECNICNAKFTQKASLSAHMFTHSEEKPHKCEICAKQFSTKQQMSLHMITHTGEKSHECNICNAKFTRKTYLSNHKMIHTGEKPHECNICNKKFITKSQLSSHMFTHSEKSYKCEICDKQFSTKQEMSCHMPTHTGEKTHECNICKAKFTRISHLSNHKMTHTGEKPHVCNICNKKFIKKINLSSHMLTHSDEKPYKCEICAKQLCTKQSMSLHMMTHTGEKPHECNICKAKFTIKSRLYTHMFTHSDKKLDK